MDELQARHRKEQKELQGKITSKKKNATKKTRKGVNDECDRLEQELKEKQRAEIAALAPTDAAEDNTSKLCSNDDVVPGDPVNVDDVVAPSMKSESGEAADSHSRDGSVQPSEGGSRKPNRQKARQARKAADLEAQMRAAEEEAANMPDQRKQELVAMKSQMDHHGLVETVIRPDGHCLYSACVQSIPDQKQKSYKDIRIAAANFMNAHPDDFAPFLEEPLDSYTHKIRDTAEWGGHLELQAIAKAFDVNINVLQASGHIEEIRPEQPGKTTAWLAYYRHSFGLGEHYNALAQKIPA